MRTSGLATAIVLLVCRQDALSLMLARLQLSASLGLGQLINLIVNFYKLTLKLINLT